MSDHLKPYIDVASISGTVAAIVGALPAATAILTFVWTIIRIYETKTVQRWLGRESKVDFHV